jgi:hypothetical protein
MYDNVYERMVDAGAAIKHDEEDILDKEGNIVTKKEEMFGCPMKYIVTKLEQILFVDETRSNTNQKDDMYYVMMGHVKFSITTQRLNATLYVENSVDASTEEVYCLSTNINKYNRRTSTQVVCRAVVILAQQENKVWYYKISRKTLDKK